MKICKSLAVIGGRVIGVINALLKIRGHGLGIAYLVILTAATAC